MEFALNTVKRHELQELEDCLDGQVIPADHADYDVRRRVWNRVHDRYPAVIVAVQSVRDVVAAVRFARDRSLPLAVRGGGHHSAGLGTCDHGVVIDMAAMRSVRVDPKSNVATVQGGALAVDVIRATQAYGLAVPTGNLGQVGMAGLTLGGGMGYLRRQYGLTCDSLLEAELVLADGSVVRVSPDEHQDLYWAVRGGGGNFGIATELRFQLYPIGPTVVGIHTMYRLDDLEAVLKGCRDYLNDVGPEVSFNLTMMPIPPGPHVPSELVGQRVVAITGMHCGRDIGQAAHAVKPLQALAEPLLDATGPISYVDLHSIIDAMLPPEHRGYTESTYVKEFSDGLIAHMAEVIRSAGPGQVFMFWPLGGRMAETANDATAFGDRKAAGLTIIESVWREPEEAPDQIAWVRQVALGLTEHAYSGGTYLNLAQTDGDVARLVRQSYGDNFTRLRTLKQQYDPANLFRHNPNIDPEEG